jgi:hypothetical protein
MTMSTGWGKARQVHGRESSGRQASINPIRFPLHSVEANCGGNCFSQSGYVLNRISFPLQAVRANEAGLLTVPMKEYVIVKNPIPWKPTLLDSRSKQRMVIA